MKENIYFHYEDVDEISYNIDCIKDTLSKICHDFGFFVFEANYIFCSDDYLLGINQQFLEHDYYTDIITFDLSPSGKAPLEAELYISVDRVKENATTLGQPFYRELHRVIFHGLLHLMGYKDKQKKDQTLMRQMEEKLLTEYFG